MVCFAFLPNQDTSRTFSPEVHLSHFLRFPLSLSVFLYQQPPGIYCLLLLLSGCPPDYLRKYCFLYLAALEFEKNFTPAISDIEGTYPEAEDEIMVSKSVLDALDINKPQKNMDI